MRKTIDTDVLVLGTGIAGVTSAIYAAKTGARVVLASSAQTFSGSTFYPGTWGLGLIGPEDDHEEDGENLIETILSIGKGMAVPSLVRTFVENLNPTMDEFETLGIHLERPAKGTEGQKEYIPCFDHKHRRWRGLTKKNLKEALPKILADLNITVLPFFEAIMLIKAGDQVVGARGIKDQKGLLTIYAKATVLATGGLSGLYRRYLTTDDVSGTGLGLALQVGAKGINVEFTQMMLGFVSPGAKTVHNEKTFTACGFYNEKNELFLGKTLPENITLDQVLLKRSQHGPFSSETMSKYLDLGLYREILGQREKSITLRYDQSKLNKDADFVKTYFNWLKKEKNISMEDDIQVAPFMHASNGGIKINERAETGVLGLYAAGEVTGGMHGADRIGGLSTANGLVFGKIAGQEAGKFAKVTSLAFNERPKNSKDFEVNIGTKDFTPMMIPEAKEKIKILRGLMDEQGFLLRREEGLDGLLRELPKLVEERFQVDLESSPMKLKEVQDSYHLYNGVISAMALVTAQKARRESRGSHYREDYPDHDDALKTPMVIELDKTSQEISQDVTLLEATSFKVTSLSKED